MKLKAVLTAVALTLCLSAVSFAQTHSMKYIIGRDPNSSDFRASVRASQRLHTSPLSPQQLGDDWAVSTGPVGGMTADMWGGVYDNFVTPACTDWAAFPINAAPTATQANLLVLTNLYRGTSGLCGTGAASVKVAYQIGTTALQKASAPDIAYAGTNKGLKLALVEGANATLHIITLGSGGTVGAPIKPDGVGTHGSEVTFDYTNITNTHCAATTVHTANNFSGVYVDFSRDEAYTADDGGKVYHFTGVFNGTPALDWCTGAVNGGNPISSLFQVNVGGTDFIYFVSNQRLLFRTQVNAARTGVTGTINIATSFAAGSTGDIMYDSDTNDVYVWTSRDNGGTHAGVYQISGQTTPMTIKGEVQLGTNFAGTMNFGEFDNTFWTLGPTATGATGYSCAYPSGLTAPPTLVSYQFDAAGTLLGTTLMTGNTNINPGTLATGNICTIGFESFDSTTGTDQLFTSVGNGTTGNNNKLSRFDITTPLSSNATLPTASVTNNPGGTSNSVLDFTDSGLGGQVQNIYFGNVARPTTSKCGGTSPNFNWCIVKLQQIGLN